MRELLIISSLGKIWREYPDKWQYDNKDLGKLLRTGEIIVYAVMSEKKEKDVTNG